MKKAQLFRRLSFGSSALLLAVSATLPSLLGQVAQALPVGDQVTDRLIRISSSSVGATSTTYNVSFKLATAHANLRGIIVDVCDGSDTPIIGDTNCAAPAGFTWGAGTPTVTLTSGISGGTWVSAATTANAGRTLKLSDPTGNNLTAGTTVNFQVTSVTNPTDTNDGSAGVQAGTFYARIVTYNATAGDFANYTAANPGSTNAIDYGGIALSLANALTVTAKVQESLTFCVYITGASCAAGTGTSVVLGDSNGVLANPALTYTSTSTATDPKLGIASNAQSGVAVKMKGENLCRKSAPADCEDADTTNIIVPQTGTCVADSVSASVEQFGVKVTTPGSGVTVDADYNCGASTQHAFNTANTTSLYGDDILATSAPSIEVTSTLQFAAKAAATTEAGIYTTNITFIATGTY